MAVKIRLKRLGRRNRAFYRIVAADSRAQRDGRAIERLGHYDPLIEDEQKKVVIQKDRIEYWLSVGAQPTQTVENILRDRGVSFPAAMKARTAEKIKSDQAKRKRRKGPGSAARAKGGGKAAAKAKAKAKAAPKKKAKPKAKKGSAKKS